MSHPHFILLFKLELQRPSKIGEPIRAGSLQCAFAFERQGRGCAHWEGALREQSGFGPAFETLCHKLLDAELGLGERPLTKDWRDELLARPSVEARRWRSRQGVAALSARAMLPCRIGADRAQVLAELLREASRGALAERIGPCPWSSADIGPTSDIGSAYSKAWELLGDAGADPMPPLEEIFKRAQRSSIEKSLQVSPRPSLA